MKVSSRNKKAVNTFFQVFTAF